MAPGWILLGLLGVAGIVAAVAAVLRLVRRRRRLELVPLEQADHDEDLRRAVAEARKTLPGFVKSFRRGRADRMYAVKAIFRDRGAIESMWVRVQSIVDDDLHGTMVTGVLDNVPAQIRNICLGDPVRIPLTRVIDWMIGSGHSFRGGATVSALARRAETRGDVPLPFNLQDQTSVNIEVGLAEPDERVDEMNGTADERG